MDKTAADLQRRMSLSGSRLLRERRVAHQAHAVAQAIQECLAVRDADPPVIIIFGASAVIDQSDVIPTAIRMAGGKVIRVGMPADHGNLLLLGQVGSIPVVGVPGCAQPERERF